MAPPDETKTSRSAPAQSRCGRHAVGPGDVDGEIVQRRLDRPGHARLCGEVEDHARMPRHGRSRRGRRSTTSRRSRRTSSGRFAARPVERSSMTRTDQPSADQSVDQMAADESGTARHDRPAAGSIEAFPTARPPTRAGCTNHRDRGAAAHRPGSPRRDGSAQGRPCASTPRRTWRLRTRGGPAIRAGGASRPRARRLRASRPLRLLVATDPAAVECYAALPDGQEIHAISAAIGDLGVGARRTVDADQERRWGRRQGAHRRGRHAARPPVGIEIRDDDDRRRVSPEGLPEQVRVGHPVEIGRVPGHLGSVHRGRGSPISVCPLCIGGRSRASLMAPVRCLLGSD